MGKQSPFPPYPIDDALVIAKTILEKNAGKPMRRLTLFDELGRSPESGPSRQLITASSGYGLTKGGYTAETIALTPEGKQVAEGNSESKLNAVLAVDIFAVFFEEYRNCVIPSSSAAYDFLKNHGISEKRTENCFRILVESGESVSIIQEISGSNRIVSQDHALEVLKSTSPKASSSHSKPPMLEKTKREEDELNKDSYRLPSLNINIQIHISPESTPEQIEKIFSCMASHLGGLRHTQ